MKDITYRCNLCRDVIDPNAKDGAVGIFYEHKLARKRDGIVFVPLAKSEHHLCGNCKRDIAEGVKDQEATAALIDLAKERDHAR